jgi:hypothetical protein
MEGTAAMSARDIVFASIRACFNTRAQDEAFGRLTFCLLGVATPSDLIRDPQLTPFNIGTRIPLRDFTQEEASVLRHGLGRDEETNRRLFERVYHWTQGHPYLTQRFCKEVAEDETVLATQDVDRCCQRLFLDPVSVTTEANLTFVSQRLAVNDATRRASLLAQYERVLCGKPVPDSETDETIAELKLSGVVRSQQGHLTVRNPIYHAVFDRSWIQEHMPGAELRRQGSYGPDMPALACLVLHGGTLLSSRSTSSRSLCVTWDGSIATFEDVVRENHAEERKRG